MSIRLYLAPEEIPEAPEQGRVVAIGRSSDAGLALDPAIPALLLFETQSESTGNFVEVR